MKLLIPVLPALALSACVETTSQSYVLARAKAEVAKRENWSDQAYVRVDRRPDDRYLTVSDYSWKVTAGAYDFSNYPNYEGIRLIPGTERELRFTRDGCLLDYHRKSRSCSAATSEPLVIQQPPAEDWEK